MPVSVNWGPTKLKRISRHLLEIAEERLACLPEYLFVSLFLLFAEITNDYLLFVRLFFQIRQRSVLVSFRQLCLSLKLRGIFLQYGQCSRCVSEWFYAWSSQLGLALDKELEEEEEDERQRNVYQYLWRPDRESFYCSEDSSSTILRDLIWQHTVAIKRIEPPKIWVKNHQEKEYENDL